MFPHQRETQKTYSHKENPKFNLHFVPRDFACYFFHNIHVLFHLFFGSRVPVQHFKDYYPMIQQYSKFGDDVTCEYSMCEA